MGKKEHQIWQRYVHQATDTILSGQKSLTRVVALTTITFITVYKISFLSLIMAFPALKN